MIEAFSTPGVLVGCVVGLGVTLLVHWLAPAGTDTVSAGAWFVGLGGVAGLAMEAALDRRRRRKRQSIGTTEE